MNNTKNSGLWQNQIEALEFSLQHPFVMLNMDMGTGKTRVVIEAAFARENIYTVLVVCPKSAVPVWRKNLNKFKTGENWACWDEQRNTVKHKAESLAKWMENRVPTLETVSGATKAFVILNYDIVWRSPMSDLLRKIDFDMIVLDESHRAKAPGSKVSKYLAMLGKGVKYRMCLSGTPMANSPLDVYGQYRFLDPTIFGTRYDLFRDEYAILGGPEHNFIVGFKNQRKLNARFQSIAYTCKMSDVANRLKLPDKLPPSIIEVELPARDMKTIKNLRKEFIAECKNDTFVVLQNILHLSLRERQITSGFTIAQSGPAEEPELTELNDVKEKAFADYLEDVSQNESLVVFYVFKHDAVVLRHACNLKGRHVFELSGDVNELSTWQDWKGSGVLIVQIQSGAEGVDMTKANRGVYFSLPVSLAQYEQSMARLYRPGQTKDVQFSYIIAKDTVDEKVFECLRHKKSLVEGVQSGIVNLEYLKK